MIIFFLLFASLSVAQLPIRAGPPVPIICLPKDLPQDVKGSFVDISQLPTPSDFSPGPQLYIAQPVLTHLQDDCQNILASFNQVAPSTVLPMTRITRQIADKWGSTLASQSYAPGLEGFLDHFDPPTKLKASLEHRVTVAACHIYPWSPHLPPAARSLKDSYCHQAIPADIAIQRMEHQPQVLPKNPIPLIDSSSRSVDPVLMTIQNGPGGGGPGGVRSRRRGMVATNTFSTSAGGKRLVLVGSSIMALWRQAPRDLAPYPVLNVAVSGSTTTDWLPSGPPFNGQGFIQSRLLNVLARGDVVVYYCGSDDINVGSKAAKIANQTLAMFNMIWGKEPSTLILFVEVIMAPEKKLLGLSSVVDEVNGLIKASSTTEERIRYVPVNYLLTSDFASGNYVFDGLHLTSKGYQIIAKRVRQALQSAKEGGGRGGGASLRMMKQLTEPYPRQHIQDQTASMRKSVINHAGLEPGRRMKQLPQQLLQNELALERESTNEVEARRRSQMGGDATEEEEPQVSASAAGGISEGLKMQNKRRLRENLMGWLDLLKLEDPWLEK